MKLLVLSTATGQGHNSVARAVGDAVRTLGGQTVELDVLKNGGRHETSGRVSRLYTGVTVHAPWLFGFAYDLGDKISSPERRSPIYYLNTLYAHSLEEKIREVGPDVIACPHIFSAQAVTYLREKHGLTVPTVGIMTDYTCSPFWEETRLDRYVIPAAALREEFVAKGLPEQKIEPLGIPVRARFRKAVPKEQARAVFGLTGHPLFLLMGGSMGYGDLPELAGELLAKMPRAQVAAVCGHNDELYRRMRELPGVRAFGYIDNVDVLMDAADVLVTKPGGISSTEAIVKSVPLIFSSPIPGCEQKNAQFLSSLGAAALGGSARQTAQLACRLVRDETLRRRMQAAQQQHIPRDADQKTARLLFTLAGTAAGALRKGGAPCL